MRAALLFLACVACSGPVYTEDFGPPPVPRIVQRDTPSGSTNVHPELGILFDMEPGSSSLATAFAAKASYFTLDGGHVAGANVSSSATQLALFPDAGLAPDTWFELKVEPDSAYRFAFNSFDERMLFFTGSAPQLRFLMRANVLKGTEHYMNIELSEPARITRLAFFDGDLRLNGCIVYDQAPSCGMPPVPMAGYSFVFAERTATYPNVTRVEVNGTSYDLGPFTSCFGSGDTVCWVRPVP